MANRLELLGPDLQGQIAALAIWAAARVHEIQSFDRNYRHHIALSPDHLIRGAG